MRRLRSFSASPLKGTSLKGVSRVTVRFPSRNPSRTLSAAAAGGHDATAGREKEGCLTLQIVTLIQILMLCVTSIGTRRNTRTHRAVCVLLFCIWGVAQ